MTAAAAQFAIEPLAFLNQSATRPTANEPLLVLAGFHYYHVPNHSGVLGSTELRTKQPIRSGALGFQPLGCVATRHDILFDAKFGQEKTMNYILGRQSEL